MRRSSQPMTAMRIHGCCPSQIDRVGTHRRDEVLPAECVASVPAEDLGQSNADGFFAYALLGGQQPKRQHTVGVALGLSRQQLRTQCRPHPVQRPGSFRQYAYLPLGRRTPPATRDIVRNGRRVLGRQVLVRQVLGEALRRPTARLRRRPRPHPTTGGPARGRGSSGRGG